MQNKIALLLFLLIFSSSAQSQNGISEKSPQAYLLSGGDARPAVSRTRFVKSVSQNTAETPTGNSKTDFALELEVFELINRQRLENGLEPLEWSDQIAEMARIHSANMANFKFFSHTDLDGALVNDRADLLGIKKWRAIGENIAYNRGYENPAESAVERWMQSPSHRENLLNNRWKESGIGIAVTEDGTYYFTEVFLLRK